MWRLRKLYFFSLAIHLTIVHQVFLIFISLYHLHPKLFFIQQCLLHYSEDLIIKKIYIFYTLNLFILNEVITNNLNYNFLNIISIISVLCGILVIISKNPIVSVLFLIGLFMSIAGYLMMLGINFIGLSYLLVYVGAVSILFLFILMLINVRISELVTDNSNSIPLAIMIGVFININQLFPRAAGMPAMMVGGFYLMKKNYVDLKGEIQPYIDFDYDYTYIGYDLNELFFVTSQSWDLRLAETFHITSIGNIIYTNYPLWLLLTSIILLLAMIGSILITIKQ